MWRVVLMKFVPRHKQRRAVFFIILRANPTDKQSEINKWDNKEIKEYGYFVNVTGHKNEYNSSSAKNVEQFKEINCNHLGEVFKRHD